MKKIFKNLAGLVLIELSIWAPLTTSLYLIFVLAGEKNSFIQLGLFVFYFLSGLLLFVFFCLLFYGILKKGVDLIDI